MGQLGAIIPKGPHQHCMRTEAHERHPNEDPGFVRGSWCNGVPEVEPFVELTVRASVAELFGEVRDHDQVLHLIGKYGLGMLVECIGKPETTIVMRVRCQDKDQMYPIIRRKGMPGLFAVTDVPQEATSDSGD